MKTRSLVIIALTAALALLAAVWISSSRTPEVASAQPGPLAPGLSEALDSVTQVRITGAGNTVLATLDRSEAGWGLVEKEGYRVDLEKLRHLLSSIATARRVEAKTALPERHAQLGVEDVAATDAHGVRVDIVTPDRTFSHVFGDNLVRGTGTYVRAADEAQSWLIGSNLAVERNPANWLLKRIIDIGANRIQAISVISEDGGTIDLARTEDDTSSDFALVNLPRGREIADGYQREALAGFLSGLVFEDVFPATEHAAPDKTRTTLFTLVDGRLIRIVSWQSEGRTHARFDMSLDEDAAQAWLARQPANDAAAGEEGPPAATLATLIDDVARFQQDHAAWVYVLPSFKASNLNKSLEDYLKPKG
ncbi:DUF4340 domain-containing protein [Xanthomonadaceae bacterium JHOS43]|nr:DUF4340 domain-containing protein [Xanthomonadaceae bacterium JHOS43]